MNHLKLSTSESHSAFNKVHAGAKVRSPLSDHRNALTVLRKLCRPCDFNVSCRRQRFRFISSYLSVCGKAFLFQPYTVVTTCVESGTLFSCLVFGNCICNMSLLKNVVGNFGVYPGEQFPSKQTYL